MKNRFFTITGGMVLLLVWTSPSVAENKIRAVVSPDGRTIYTNIADTEPTPFPSAPKTAASPMPVNDPIQALIESIAGTHGVDPALVRAMIKTESNFNRWAVSSKGALGLMQLIPTTGRRFGVRDFYDPKQNIEGGVRYIKFLLEKFKGNLDLSLAAYNAGENLVERLGRIPSIPETRDYVRKVRASYGKSPVTAVPVAQMTANTTPAAPPEPARQPVFVNVDERGVVHFSNVAPFK